MHYVFETPKQTRKEHRLIPACHVPRLFCFGAALQSSPFLPIFSGQILCVICRLVLCAPYCTHPSPLLLNATCHLLHRYWHPSLFALGAIVACADVSRQLS